jgi:hypothetical protein
VAVGGAGGGADPLKGEMAPRLKHRWRVDQNYLLGITFGQWRRLLREDGDGVDPAYWHRAALVTAVSLLNTLGSRAEERQFGSDVHKTVITEPPLFVLGHWRTGTTLLHNLISRDPRFGYPNVFDTNCPGTLLRRGKGNGTERNPFLPAKREMDNVAVDIDLPQEDEFALALSCLCSPDLALSFPRRWERYLPYLTFDGVAADRVEEWKRTFVWFSKKLTLKYGRPLVLKSPPHTARIRLLLELFPDARFVNIHREPYTVFQSWRHTQDTMAWLLYMQKPDLGSIDDRLLRMGGMLFDAYFAQRHLIPPDRLVDVAYEDLEARPVEVVQDIYTKLGLPVFEEFRPKLQAYVDSLRGYQKNRFPELAPEVREKVAASWRRAFEEWAYPV